ncbi:hypothetical protein [Azospirillum picis]|uniref:Uncharacterized protein n=1 Tax=Azospirillum picis TaxID=488438 RepID=A0ABU0MEK2_9PROT|nr:hypothetical protein [Azospirillum picis]MBP2297960.1 hypothetical protein [Azospirillum picis]MDQ0531798.1 hypothetical protein [Azospirillum picis]
MKIPFSFAHLRPGAAAGPVVPPGTPKPASGAVTPPVQPAASGDDKPKEGEEDETEDEDDKQAASVRRKERERCAAIFAAPAAAGRVELAATLAFGTDLPAQQAIAVLEAAPAAAAPSTAQAPANPLAAAMAALGNPSITPDGGASGGGDDVSAEVSAIMNLHAAHNGAPAK